MVRIFSSERMEQVRDMLARHDARLIKFVDTWTVTDLSPLALCGGTDKPVS
jgi:hypothetical protein